MPTTNHTANVPEDVADAAVARPRFMTLLRGVFAGLGTMAWWRTWSPNAGRELAAGRRSAPTAHASSVWTRSRPGAFWVGLAIGLASVVGLSRVLLFDVAPTDPRWLG